MSVSFHLTLFGLSVDCLNMISLATGLNLNIKQPVIWNLLQIDCCNTTGITCANDRVDVIEWVDYGLDGFINGTALPSELNTLYLYSNDLTGGMPQILPPKLERIDLALNRLSGPLIKNIPPTLGYVMLYYNAFTGTIPSYKSLNLFQLYVQGNMLHGDAPEFPAMYYLCIRGNQITGSVIFRNQPYQVLIGDNWINDILITDTSELNSGCEIDNNPLLGNPNIVNLTMCSQTGLYNASSLPITVSSSLHYSSTLTLFTSKFAKSSIEVFESKSTATRVTHLASKITAVKTAGTATTCTEFSTIVSTVHFVPLQISSKTSDYLRISLRVFVSIIVFIYVVKVTPFKRILESAVKEKTRRKTNYLSALS